MAVGGVDHADLSKKLKETFGDWREVALDVPQETGKQKRYSNQNHVLL